jgi:hypothetical protein
MCPISSVEFAAKDASAFSYEKSITCLRRNPFNRSFSTKLLKWNIFHSSYLIYLRIYDPKHKSEIRNYTTLLLGSTHFQSSFTLSPPSSLLLLFLYLLIIYLVSMVPPQSTLLSSALTLLFRMPWNRQFPVASLTQSQNSHIGVLFS